MIPPSETKDFRDGITLRQYYDKLYETLWDLEEGLDGDLRGWVIEGGMVFDLRDQPEMLAWIEQIRDLYKEIAAVKQELDDTAMAAHKGLGHDI